MAELSSAEKTAMEKELRRRQSILSTTGLGVIAFGLWSFLKMNLYFLLGADTMFNGVEIDPSISRRLVFVLSYILGLIIACVILFVHARIGRSAISEAKGVQKRYRYVGVSTALIVFYIASVVFTVITLDFKAPTFPDYIASILVDSTSVIMFTELVLSARKVRSLRQELQKEAGER